MGSVVSLNQPLAYYRAHGTGDSKWDRPDFALLEGEINRFHKRWMDVCNLLDLEKPPFGSEQPLYVLERRLMQSVLLQNKASLILVIAYVRRLFASHLPTRQKLLLVTWAAGLLTPVPQWRRRLVFARRSPLNRPPVLRRLVGGVTQIRRNLRVGSRNRRGAGALLQL
jgi:hypothetical protein